MECSPALSCSRANLQPSTRDLAGMREAYQPEGEQEELLLKDLTLTELRRRRLRLAKREDRRQLLMEIAEREDRSLAQVCEIFLRDGALS